MPESLFIYNFLFYLFKLCLLSHRECLLFLLVKSSLSLHTWLTISYLPLENTNMSYTVERIINLILEDKTKPRRCVKDPCGWYM